MLESLLKIEFIFEAIKCRGERHTRKIKIIKR